MPNGHYLHAITCLPLPACHYLLVTILQLIRDESAAYYQPTAGRRSRLSVMVSVRAAVLASAVTRLAEPIRLPVNPLPYIA